MFKGNSEENSISEYKNLDIELEKEISKVNNSMRTLAEGILSVYNMARQKGFEPLEARKIVEDRIINVTPQYLRRLLPEEAKQTQMRRQPIAKHVSQKLVYNEPENITIPQRKEVIQEIEPIPEQEQPINKSYKLTLYFRW